MKTKIIILAGGKGKRMGGELPKVLTLLNGKPLISYLIDSIKKSNCPDNPIAVIGFRADLVKEKLGDSVEYAFQERQLGTGHAVMCAKNAINEKVENIVVLYGDMPNIKSETIKKLLEIHNNEKPVITMMTIRVPHFEENYAGFMGFGRIVRNSEGEIEKIVEMRDATDEQKQIAELNPSLFCFNSNWLWENLPKIKNHNAQGEYYLTDLVGLAIEQRQKIVSLEIDPMECIGVNTLEELKSAERILVQQ